MADRSGKAVAAIHAGWRGTVRDVAGAAVRAITETFGTRPKDLVAAIGPRICGGCYEVGSEVVDSLDKLGLDGGWRGEGRRVDLGVANASLLLRAGLEESSVEVLPCCTCCDRRFVSWRRDRIEDERQFNFIVVTGES